MIELRNQALKAEPSQGSHFFQNITSLGIPYLTVREELEKNDNKCSSKSGKDCINWDWLLEQDNFEDGKYIRHIRLEQPFIMKCDGKEEMAVLYMEDCERKDESKCNVEFKG